MYGVTWNAARPPEPWRTSCAWRPRTTTPPSPMEHNGDTITVRRPDLPTVLSTLDMSLALGKAEYRTALQKHQGKLNRLQRAAQEQQRLHPGGVRGLGRRRQGGVHPPLLRRHGRAQLPGDSLRRAHRRGAGPPLPVALLARPGPCRPDDVLRPQLVRPGAGGAGRGLRHRGGVGPRLQRDRTSSRSSWWSTASCWSSSGCTSPRRSSSARSRSGEQTP